MRVILSQLSKSFVENELQEILEDLHQVEFVGVFYYEYDHTHELYSEKKGLKIWTYDQLTDGKKYISRTPYHEHYERIRSVLLADSRTYFLAERLFGKGGLTSVFNSIITVELIIWNSLGILYESQPDRFFSGSTPHDSMWFFAKVAELMGVEVYLSPYSPLPWKRWIVKNLEDQTPVALLSQQCLENEKSMEKINQ
ncbi:MAG: hypothetical protein QCI00_06335, partial [Candidatus Thermoplasmatota archaeon]|nr:hypothetical protein [Candidatus Thermoplasmatota archaeon]